MCAGALHPASPRPRTDAGAGNPAPIPHQTPEERDMFRPILLSTALLTALAPAQETTKNLVQVAAEAGQFQILLAAAKAAGLADTLAGKGPFTIFAPTDAAFGKLGDAKIAELLKPENKDTLAGILKYHVVAGSLPAAKVTAVKELTSLQGSPLAVVVADGKVTIAGANVVATDVTAQNGVIHVIDAVVLPPAMPNLVEAAAKAGTFTTLLAAAKAAGLADTLANGGPFTVFAPTDEAFAKLGKETIAELLQPANRDKLAGILKHHVVAGRVVAADAVKLSEAKTIGGTTLPLKWDGKTLAVGGAKVVATDVAAKNGVIHVVDAVILPAN
ncbi:MAG: fasciclin domain-containing protein [Planctomycetes bacterium]|nr:fasciclin domain-containing protein [Planctomycetota bacterium]